MFTVKKYIIGLILGTMIFSGIAIVDDLIVKLSIGIAASFAFSIVGSFYTAGLISSRADGGKARLFIFLILLAFFLYVFTQIAKGIIWLFSFPLWIYIVLISVGAIFLILVMVNNYKIAKRRYTKQLKVEVSPKTNLVPKEAINENIAEVEPILRSIRELLLEEKEKNFILATTNNPYSPGLEYVKVYKNALGYSNIKGYIKMDHAAAFWGDIFYANEKIWIKY
jgi:predicted membrane channel-forming protein YqfA (hemolysin III family)